MTAGGEAIRSLRQIAGLTLADVAKGADTAISYLSRVERGDVVPSGEYLGRVTNFISLAMLQEPESAAA